MIASLLKSSSAGKRAIAAHLTTNYPHLSPAQRQEISRVLILQLLTLWLWQQSRLPGLDSTTILQGERIGERLAEHWCRLQLPCNRPAYAQTIDFPDPLLRSIIHSLAVSVNFSDQKVPFTTLGQIYEHLLDDSLTTEKPSSTSVSRTRKANGIYYTPEAIAQYSVEAVLNRLLASSPNGEEPIPKITLLDPACGGGIFLLKAYQFLLDRYLQRYSANPEQAKQFLVFRSTESLAGSQTGSWQLTQAERSRILLTHLYGVDLDPQAIEVTKLVLVLQWMVDLPDGSLPLQLDSLPDLSQNFRCGNAVIESDQGLNWAQVFPAILQAGGFDAVIGNPPYLDSEWMTTHLPDWRRYCVNHYRTASGNWDLFCVFIEKAWQLCKPGGLTSLVVPNKLASANYAAMARSILTPGLLAIRDYSRVAAFRALIYPLVYVAQKQPCDKACSHKQVPRSPTQIWYEEMESLDRVAHCRWLSWNASPRHPWQFTQVRSSAWMDRLPTQPSAPYRPLGKVAIVTGAATVGQAYALQSWIQDQPLLTATDLRLVNSGTIDRYILLWGKKPMRYLGQSYLHPQVAVAHLCHLPPKRRQQARQPKIIVAGMTQVLECGIDPTGSILAGKSTTIIRAIAPLDLRYLLGLLNSRLLSLYVRTWFSGNQLQGGYLRIGAPQLRQLPIWIPNLSNPSDRQKYDQLITWVDERLHLAQSQFQAQPQAQDQNADQADGERLDRTIDEFVCQLYQLQDSEIEEVLSDRRQKHGIEIRKNQTPRFSDSSRIQES